MTDTLNTRNASLEDLVDILRQRQSKRHDIVVSASQVHSKNGNLVVKNAEKEITDSGVTDVDGTYRPTEWCDGQLSEKLGIPRQYVRKLRTEAVDMLDANINGWIHGKYRRGVDGLLYEVRPADDRKFLVRTFSDGNGTGVARSVLSDSYGTLDDVDFLTAALAGVRDSGVEVEVRNCSLSDSKMFVDVFAPAVSAAAPVLLNGYRNPFSHPDLDARRQHGRNDVEWQRQADKYGLGTAPDGAPIVFSGFRITNSEVGAGAATICPLLLVQVCTNGMKVSQDAVRKVHLGQRLDQGIVQYSADTQRKAIDLVTAQARDAVKTFLDVQYLERALARIESKAGKPVEGNPTAVIETVGKALLFSKEEQADILNFFVRGGQMTSGGVVNAITAYSQTVGDADRADALDSAAMKALELV